MPFAAGPSPTGNRSSFGQGAVSRSGSIAIGVVATAVGLAIIAASFFADAGKFHSPRWVVAAAGGAFVFFGTWTAVLYALGFDPRRPDSTLPSPGIQLLVFVPGMALFAAPFHWIAFGKGPRQFSGSFSVPFLSVRSAGGETCGRVLFGIGALMVDAILVGAVVRLVRQMRGGAGARAVAKGPGS